MTDTIYPDPTCMECGKLCDNVEYHDVGKAQEQMWCWCTDCKIDTFHQPNGKDNENKGVEGELTQTE